MEIVELLPGVFVRFELYCRVRALLGLLGVLLVLYAGDRSGIARLDFVPELPAAMLEHKPATRPAGLRDPDLEAGYQLTYLDRFLAARTQPLELMRYVGSVLPPAVRMTRVTAIAEDTITGREKAGPTLRVEGRAPDQDRLRAFEDSLRVMAPALSLARFAQVGADDGGYSFLLSTEPARDPAAP